MRVRSPDHGEPTSVLAGRARPSFLHRPWRIRASPVRGQSASTPVGEHHLDLSGLRFVDCTRLRTLVQAHNECLAHRGTLILDHVGRPAARLLELTGLSEVLFISDKGPAPARVR